MNLTRPALAGFAVVLAGIAMIAFAVTSGSTTTFGQEDTPTPDQTEQASPTPGADETPEMTPTVEGTATAAASPTAQATNTPTGGAGGLPETGTGSAAGDAFPAWLLGAGIILAVTGSAFALAGARRGR